MNINPTEVNIEDYANSVIALLDVAINSESCYRCNGAGYHNESPLSHECCLDNKFKKVG